MSSVFSEFAHEIQDLEHDGVLVSSKNILVIPVYDCDYQALYVMLSVSRASSTYIFPFCRAKYKKWTKLLRKLATIL